MPAAAPKLMTTAELLAIPDDGVERWLYYGELRENPTEGATLEKPMTVRNRVHSDILIRVGQHLANWRDLQPEPRGAVLGGEAGMRLEADPDLTVGVDVVYVSAEVAALQDDESTLIVGVPILAVEILSPSDRYANVNDEIDSYLEAGVAIVWVIDPRRRTVQVLRPNREPELVARGQTLTAEPELPGFSVPAAKLFA